MNRSTDQLNIIFLGESYLGGMAGSKRIQNLINALLKIEGVSISNLIIHDPNDSIASIKKGEKNNVNYEIISYNIKNPFSFLKFYMNARRFILNNRHNTFKNILYCYDNPTFFNYPILWFARKKKYKLVVDIVEDYSLSKKTGIGFKKKFILNKQDKLLQSLSEYADGVIAISTYLKEKLLNDAKKKIPVLYLPITVDFSYFMHTNIKSENKIKIFYGGSFGEKDGLLFLLNAFEKMAALNSDLQLILTGKPPKQGMAEVIKFIDNSGYKERINYLGYLNDKEYYEVMNGCDIFCMTRIDSQYAKAGFPFKLGEMLATGKPVIATRTSNVADYLTDKKNAILISPNSVDEIISAVEFILNDPIAAKEIGKAGKQTAKDSFDTDAIIGNLKNFLLEV